MASIQIERTIDASADEVWAALRDFGALHTRVAPGFVVDTVVDGDVRTVTFGEGLVLRERLIAIDDINRRIVYSILAELFEHHNASNAVIPQEDGRCRFVWVADFLPDAPRERVQDLMNKGADAIKSLMERSSPTQRG